MCVVRPLCPYSWLFGLPGPPQENSQHQSKFSGGDRDGFDREPWRAFPRSRCARDSCFAIRATLDRETRFDGCSKGVVKGTPSQT
jgi:hypothetical protein